MRLRILIAMLVLSSISVYSQSADSTLGYVLRHESEVGKTEPGSHDGGGMTTGYYFFDNVEQGTLFFRKRVLHPGSAIGSHLQGRDEIFYCLSGKGMLTMNGKEIEFNPGDAVLTLPGTTHSLRQTGESDLVIFIVSEKKKTP